ncbi:solute carrier family 25 protein [Patellaria atrata CBS 101060]|uniref:Solute carrier family 25 protein n=1 Tax=Patellaria atrata CBS 101060 TaxID=1346257 RepID=A0A9P4S3X6_9PEZI|nr:solute carrier family 25 protein [Patellaria atrata CBS 101060]
MTADFWAGYISGAAGILIGNPLDLLKTRLQAGSASSGVSITTASSASQSYRNQFEQAGTLLRGATAPILGYGALNALLFYTYNRSLLLLNQPFSSMVPQVDHRVLNSGGIDRLSITSSPPVPNLLQIWMAGALGGLATFIVSAPTELIKCRAQVAGPGSNTSSVSIARNIWKSEGVRGLYFGGCVTAIRDAIGYGFYFWSYELSMRSVSSQSDTEREKTWKILLCGGLAGIVTWASIFPLDVVKTRVQTQRYPYAQATSASEREGLLGFEQRSGQRDGGRRGALEIARLAYSAEGLPVFFRGLGVCSVRAFIVNSVQWFVYEWMVGVLL